MARAHLGVRHDDVVVGSSTDRDRRRRELVERELADDRSVLLGHIGGRRHGRGRRMDGSARSRGRRRSELTELHEQGDRHRDRTERDDASRVEWRGLVCRNPLPVDPCTARRTVVPDHEPIEQDRRVVTADRRMRDDPGGSRGLTADDHVAVWRLELPRLEQHPHDGRVRHRHRHLTDREDRPEVEWRRLASAEGRAGRRARAGAEVDEHELTVALQDARMMRSDPVPLQHDIVVRRAAERDLLLA